MAEFASSNQADTVFCAAENSAGVNSHTKMLPLPQDEQDALSPVQVGVSFAGILVFRSSKPSFQLTWDNMVSIRFKGKKFIAQLKHPAVSTDFIVKLNEYFQLK
ncbi:unnamed protein product [Dicrocoelium dendriticum]|nr:unnamed protein product [Dicrocoelium dendriticum]